MALSQRNENEYTSNVSSICSRLNYLMFIDNLYHYAINKNLHYKKDKIICKNSTISCHRDMCLSMMVAKFRGSVRGEIG